VAEGDTAEGTGTDPSDPLEPSATEAIAALDERRQRAILALLEGKTKTAAAKAAGVNRDTLRKWESEDAFKGALSRGQTEVAVSRMDRLRRAIDLGVSALVDLLEAEPPDHPGEDAGPDALIAYAQTVVAFHKAKAMAASTMLQRLKPFELRDLDNAASGSGALTDEDWNARYVEPDGRFVPHAKQREAIKAAERFIVLVAGVQSGKTTGAAVLFWKRLMEWVKAHEGPGRRGFFWMLAPNSIVGEVMCERFEELAPPNWITSRTGQKGDRTWVLRDGSRVQFRSAEHADKLVARTLDGAWLDEFTLMKQDVWLTSVRQRLAATGGWVVFSGTPRGRNWAFEHIWRRTIEGDDNYDPSWRGFTWHSVENPAVSPAEVEAARSQLPPAYFRREWEASWEAFHGQVYDGWGDHLVVDAMAPPLPSGTVTVIGVDWGFATNGALVVARRYPGGVWEIVEEVQESGRLPAWWTARIVRAWQEHKAHRIWCDPADPGRIATLVDEGLPAIAANNDVMRGIREIAALITQKCFRVARRCQLTISQLASYHWKKDAKGHVQEAPAKENDHLCDAGRYAIFSENERALSPAVKVGWGGRPLGKAG